jgi:hypothetical protein
MNYLSALALIGAGFLFCVPSAKAAVSRSTTYAIEYDAIGNGGGVAESGDGNYSMVSLFRSHGVQPDSSSSSTYTVESILAEPNSSGSSAVINWEAY